MVRGSQISFSEKYGRLLVIKEIGRNKHGKKMYECLCDCGNTINSLGVYLRNGDTKSCGCYGQDMRKKSVLKHGQSHNKLCDEYQIWKAIRQRCLNPKHASYWRYGGRGIFICERWNDFSNFLADMGKRPSKGHSIDRIDNNGNYEPKNCRWATVNEQSRNKKNNRWYEYDGLKMILEDWASFWGIDQSTLHEHLESKTIEQIANFYKKKKR